MNNTCVIVASVAPAELKCHISTQMCKSFLPDHKINDESHKNIRKKPRD